MISHCSLDKNFIYRLSLQVDASLSLFVVCNSVTGVSLQVSSIAFCKSLFKAFYPSNLDMNHRATTRPVFAKSIIPHPYPRNSAELHRPQPWHRWWVTKVNSNNNSIPSKVGPVLTSPWNGFEWLLPVAAKATGKLCLALPKPPCSDNNDNNNRVTPALPTNPAAFNVQFRNSERWLLEIHKSHII